MAVENALLLEPVTPNILEYQESALAAMDEISKCETNIELLHTAHRLWCSPACPKDFSCGFLHYPRHGPLTAPTRSPRPRYNKDTVHLFNLMGNNRYVPNTAQTHQVNTWPLLEAILERADIARSYSTLVYCDYTDWTKKKDSMAQITVESICRDAIQWMANWCGAEFAASEVSLHYIALIGIVDDICIPPLDIAHDKFCLYGRTCRDLVKTMVEEGWARDATHVLLSLIRQYLLQYAEKIGFNGSSIEGGIHASLSQSCQVWDSTVYRTYTANTYGAAVVIGRVTRSGPLTTTWLIDSAICDAISMDLAKSCLRVYQQDNHIPTTAERQPNIYTKQGLELMREDGYHSIYLDLIDALVHSSCPDPLVHFGHSGFLFVQMQDRYLERRAGKRFHIQPAMRKELNLQFGIEPTDARLDGIFCLQRLSRMDNLSPRKHHQQLETSQNLCPELLLACQACLKSRKQAFDLKIPFEAESYQPNLCSCAQSLVEKIHNMSAKVETPEHLHRVLINNALPDAVNLSSEDISSIGSLENIWALCASCQVDCSNRCEWLSFARLVARRTLRCRHATLV